MKAIALLSGGLDSILASKITKDLGIELIAFNTVTPFCVCTHRSQSGCVHGAASAAKQLGLKFISHDVAAEFLPIVKSPKHGYGSHMNPCIDCRILLFNHAKELMRKEGASFIITGEVVGQRPMSQRKYTLDLIEREAGLEGFIVRPLSAQLLPKTIPEEKGWISREKLLAIGGRSRREQFELAKQLGINDYPCPSGGCLLTDPEFSRKLKDLIAHDGLTLRNVTLLKIGRHFRLNENTTLVVGRNEKENARLPDFAQPGEYLFTPPEEIAGPTALGKGMRTPEELQLACAIVARYCDKVGNGGLDITCTPHGESPGHLINACPVTEASLSSLRI